MAEPLSDTDTASARSGFFAGLVAYTIWGLFPIYFVAVTHVPTLEILAHRVIWSLPFGFLILLFRRQIAETLRAIATPRTVALLAVAAVALAANWGVYIWAIQQGQIFQGSLGYYINPLVYVLAGVVLYKEKLSPLQGVAILCAFIGVAILTMKGGVFPGIAIFLAFSFALYGVMRKYIVIGAMPGLFIEVVILLPPAVLYLIYASQEGIVVWGNLSTSTNLLLVLAGPLTVLPLLAFAFAARRIKLSTLGILQYVGPTLQFACGVYFGEEFTAAHAWCFGFIWLGVGLFALDAIRKSRLKVSPVSP